MNRRQARGICAATLVTIVLSVLSGCIPLLVTPHYMTDPQFDYDWSTGGWSFVTPHEPAAVYRALLSVVEDNGRKIEKRFDDELRMTVSYPGDWWPVFLLAGVMTIECFGTDMGTKCLFVRPSVDGGVLSSAAVEPVIEALEAELEK